LRINGNGRSWTSRSATWPSRCGFLLSHDTHGDVGAINARRCNCCARTICDGPIHHQSMSAQSLHWKPSNFNSWKSENQREAGAASGSGVRCP
jgi:hypothetical protein